MELKMGSSRGQEIWGVSGNGTSMACLTWPQPTQDSEVGSERVLAREPRSPLLRDVQHLLLQSALAQGVAGQVAVGVAELVLVTWGQRERGKG